jgi:predicted DNA-binding antitoxin AbrB/MazE fold protein
MTLTVEAVLENGQLKLKTPLALPEGTAVRLTVTPLDEDRKPSRDAPENAAASPDDDPLMKWAGALDAPVSDVADNHDRYLGLGLHRELRGTRDE